MPRRRPGRGGSGGGWASDAANVQGATAGDIGCSLEGSGFAQGDAVWAVEGEVRGEAWQAWLDTGGGAAFNGDDEQVFHGGWLVRVSGVLWPR